MRKDFGAKPWIYPQVVFIIGTYNEDGTPNAMNAAWGGVGDTEQIFMCISSTHKTTENILRAKEFTVSLGTLDQMVACDYVGLVSGNDDPEKMARTGWHFSKASQVNAPVIDELPMTFECKLISYNAHYGYLFGEILNLSVDKRPAVAAGFCGAEHEGRLAGPRRGEETLCGVFAARRGSKSRFVGLACRFLQRMRGVRAAFWEVLQIP